MMTQAEYDDPDYPVMAEYEDGHLRMVPYFEMPLTFENRGGCIWISMLDMYCPLSCADIEDITVSLERAKEGVFLEGFDDEIRRFKAPGGRPGASPRPPRTGTNTGRSSPPGRCTGRSARTRGT